VRRVRCNRSTGGHFRTAERYVGSIPRLLRSSLPDGYFHVVSRGVFGAAIYVDDADRGRFVRLLGHCTETYGWHCHAYCLMTTHYHLVVEARRRDLSKGVQHLNSEHAQGFNHRHGRYGALFAERFSARAIASEEHLFEACAYVVLNPVKARLCERVDEWPWSFSSFGLDAT
jgi:putative transposase